MVDGCDPGVTDRSAGNAVNTGSPHVDDLVTEGVENFHAHRQCLQDGDLARIVDEMRSAERGRGGSDRHIRSEAGDGRRRIARIRTGACADVDKYDRVIVRIQIVLEDEERTDLVFRHRDGVIDSNRRRVQYAKGDAVDGRARRLQQDG